MNFLLPKSKWEKIGLLGLEQFIILKSVIKGLFRTNLAKINKESPGSGNALFVEQHSWSYETKLAIPKEIMDSAGAHFVQDKPLDSGLVSSVYDYQSAVCCNASIYSNAVSHVSIFDRHGQRIPEFSSVKFNYFVPSTCRIKPNRFIPGTTLSLFGNVENSTGNIGHWMVDGVSRLFLALEHHAMEDIDHFLVPELKYDFQRESLISLGIDAEKILEIKTLECVSCESLIVTTAPRGYSSSNTPGWMIDGYREAMLKPGIGVKAGKRLYISRRDANSRKFVNESEIIDYLQGFGFETIEMSDYNYQEKIALFSDAEIIVGLTGAGLTNVVFCHPSTIVLELFPESYVTYFYTSVAIYLGMQYRYLVFKNDSLLSDVNRYYGNLDLDVDLLAVKIQEIMLLLHENTHSRDDTNA